MLMSDERPDLPEVLTSPTGTGDVDPSDTGRHAVQSGGNGDLPLPQEEVQPEEGTEPGVDGDQDPQKEIKAWFRAAEGLVLAYWHDPRTAIKYAVAILRLLQEGKTEAELLAIDPTAIAPITETQVGWQ